MLSGIEVRYLMIEWQAEGVARSIECAPSSLEVDPSEGEFGVEATIFNDFHPWLGVCLSPDLEHIAPTLVTAAGQETPMLRVEDPNDDKSWWLQNNGWDPSGKRHLSELHRSPGLYRIKIGDAVLRVDNQLSSFGRADIQAYVEDFRGDLLWMIMNDDAGATATGKGSSSGIELADAMEDLRAASQKVLASPAVTIRERQAPQPIAKLRPSSATFRDHARNPAARQLTGRTFDESADTAENRYLRHMLAVAIKVENAYASAASLQSGFLLRLASQETDRAGRHREMDMRPVDPEVFDEQAKEIQQKLDSIAGFSDVSDDKGGQFGRFPISLGRRYYQKYSFYYTPQDKPAGGTSEVDYRVVLLPETVFDRVVGAHHFCRDFTIEGNVISRLQETQRGKKFRELRFASVSAIEPQTDAIEKKAKRRLDLVRSNWMVRISDGERRELRREAAAADRRADRALAKQREITSAVKELQRARVRLAEIDVGLADLGISCSSSFPMGMRYVSNPDYAACVSAFKFIGRILERDGLDLARLERIDSIGILHASDIYEKWCLLKIIMLLVTDFRFQPDSGWKEKLIESSLSRENNVRFEFSRADLAMRAVLTCQGELPNGRRPDFVLQIFDTAEKSSHFYDNGGMQERGIVMDAKFRSEWKSHGPDRILDELVLAKGYNAALHGGKVFILQPCGSTVRPAASPLEWGRHCNYGSTLSHRKGWIQAGVASSGTSSTLHLKRLLAMLFQDAFPEPTREAGDSESSAWTSRSFCIDCGERHATASVQAKETKAGLTWWRLDCRLCGVWTDRTHCYNCKEPLFKNGTMWTYHGTLADQVTNVICPDCGSYFDEHLN